ncbi:hypothetical protein Tco_0871968, partial [Tanacetum coccineum]
MYRPTYKPPYLSSQPNQVYSLLNRLNLDMDTENLFNKQEYYAGQGSGGNQEFYTGQDYSMGYGSAHGSAPVEDDSLVKKVAASTKAKKAQCMNLNDDVDGSGEEAREVRVGGDRAKKKSSTSSRSEASSRDEHGLGTGGNGTGTDGSENRNFQKGCIVDMVTDKWKSFKSVSWGKKKEQQQSYIELKNRELDIHEKENQEAAELKRQELELK